MIDHIFQIAFSNVCISLVLAIIAAIAGITLKRPVITHLLWLLVFVKLLTPPVLTVSLFPLPYMDETSPPVNFNIAEQKDMQGAVVRGSNEIENLLPEKISIVPIQIKHWLFMTWISGSMVVLIWSTLQVYRFHRLLKKESEIGSPEVQSAAKKIAVFLGLKAVPTIHTTSANISPMVWWIGGKVWIVIPIALIKQMDAGQIRWILSHELAHVRRRDYMIRWIEWICCILFWWNPVTWWARYNLRANEELCCDALVLSSMKPKPYTYGDSLLKAIEILAYPTQQPLVIASGINNSGLLKRRVKMIVSKNLNKSKLRWLQASIMLGALIVLPLGFTNAQNPITEKRISEFNETSPEDVMFELEEQRKFPELFIGEILQLIKKDDMWLTLLQQKRNRLDIKGVAPSNAAIAYFMDNLESSSLFQDITLQGILLGQVGNQRVSNFHIFTMLNFNPDISLDGIPQEVLEKITTQNKEIPDLLTKINKILVDAGLVAQAFLPGKVNSRHGYSEIPIQLKVKGRYENIVTSFGAMRRIDRFVMFRDIEVQSEERDSDVEMSMTLVAYQQL